MASAAKARTYHFTQPRLGKGWLKRLVREIRWQASVRGRLATVQGQNRVTLPTPKGGSNREYKADLPTGAVLPTRPQYRNQKKMLAVLFVGHSAILIL